MITSFDGEKAYRWFVNVETYFEANGILEKGKTSRALKALIGDSLNLWLC